MNPVILEGCISYTEMFERLINTMKNQYLTAIAAIAILSLSGIAGCTSATDTAASPSSAMMGESASPQASAGMASTMSDKAGALAQELQGKPVVVDIYASWCPACKNVAPTLAKLNTAYAGKATFVVLDVSDKTTTAKAEATAKKLGLEKFLAENKAATGTIAILDPATGNMLATQRNNATEAAYKTPLDAFIAKAK
jgi:thiol-disulfide isomerase/thioredoxin